MDTYLCYILGDERCKYRIGEISKHQRVEYERRPKVPQRHESCQVGEDCREEKGWPITSLFNVRIYFRTTHLCEESSRWNQRRKEDGNQQLEPCRLNSASE